MRKIIMIAVCLLLHSVCFASEPDTTTLKKLSASQTWLKLLHLEKKMTRFGAYQSAIQEKDFFLHPNGEQDPYQELSATLAAMSAPVTHENQHVRCLYPARVKWIESTLGQTNSFDLKKHCPAYSKWRFEKRATSVSVILATGYLGNPASYYGHTFVKFNSDGANTSKDLMNMTVNYGAINTQSDHPVLYIVKSVLGGYDAAFSKINFYHHEQVYNENENRDLWDFELNLSQSEVDFIVDHAWEIMEKKYTYYFFKENCAFRMIELIEILPEIDVTSKHQFFTIPQTLMQNIASVQRHGKPLIRKKTYYPSRQSRFYAKYKNLNIQEQQSFKEMVLKDLDVSLPSYQQLNTSSQQKVVDTIIDYYRFVEEDKTKQQKSKHPNYIKALGLRYQLPAAKEEEIVVNASPEQGRAASLVQLAAVSSSGFSNATSIRIRPAYYDALDSDTSHVKNSALSMGDTQFLIKNGEIKLQKLDIVTIESANPGLTGLKGDKSTAWKFKLGAEQYKTGCLSCLVPRLQGDYGLGINLFEHLYVAGYLGGGIQNDRFKHEDVFVRSSLDAIYRPSEKFGLKLNIEERFNFEHAKNTRFIRTDMRYAFMKNFDIRAQYERQFGEESEYLFTLGLGSYW
jgi:hypothetical protein